MPRRVTTAPAITVRPRVEADVPTLIDVVREQQPTSGYPRAWPPVVGVREFLVRPDEEAAWVAVHEGRVVGHVSVTSVHDDEHGAIWSAGAGRPVDQLGCVSVLFVASDVQGMGAGGRLLDAAEQHLRARGRTPVLDVDDRDGVAHAVYVHRGWQVVGEARFFWQAPDSPPARLLVLP
ncbi:GNAT family N-acetyltransferase [Isoptericola sp. NPDC019571]|uniref:GNAT family N-acetyltransferase n=1 Tax=Isoptericola sp. NPDC019571 TaxID=3364008 RepID=UPI00379FAB27